MRCLFLALSFLSGLSASIATRVETPIPLFSIGDVSWVAGASDIRPNWVPKFGGSVQCLPS